jgi:hypothetical protein
MPGSKTTPGRTGARLRDPRVAFRHRDVVGARNKESFAAQWLAYASPADASPSPSRSTAHGSGPMRSLTFTVKDFHLYSLPVSRRTPILPPNSGHSQGRSACQKGPITGLSDAFSLAVY